jgi:hypothetical protein
MVVLVGQSRITPIPHCRQNTPGTESYGIRRAGFWYSEAACTNPG